MCFYFQALLKSITVVFLHHSSEGGFRGLFWLHGPMTPSKFPSLPDLATPARLVMTDNPILACLLARDPMEARSNFLQKRPRVQTSRPSGPSPGARVRISGPQSTIGRPWVVSSMSRANKQASVALKSRRETPPQPPEIGRPRRRVRRQAREAIPSSRSNKRHASWEPGSIPRDCGDVW